MLPQPETEIPLPKKTERIRSEKRPPFVSAKNILFAFLTSAIYLLLSFFLVGFKTEQLVLVTLFNFCYFASRGTRRFILGFSIFIVYWIVFDYMKAFPNYWYNEVHIASLYQAEKTLFGIQWNNNLLTPNEYFAQHTSSFLDVLSGLSYLCWVPVPLAFASILFFRNRNAFFQFSLTFFLVNIIGFIGYYIYPAAPPWYVAKYGFNFIPTTPGNTAGLSRFDALFGISVFKSIYAKSSNVFAAMPSLHASYMMIVLFYGLKFRLKAWNILFAIIMIGIWFAAIYSGHHYILDVLAGITCAAIGIAIFQFWLSTKTGKMFINYLLTVTAK